MTSQDRHFLESWLEQREGPRWKYYVQYIIAWTVVIFLCIFFLLLLIGGRGTGGKWSFIIVLAISIIFAFFTTHLVYSTNEKRLKSIQDQP